MAEPRPRLHVWRGPQGAAAVTVVAVTVLWRGVLAAQSFFNQDDYYLTSRALRADISWSFLFEPTAGHVQPAQQVSYWLVANHVPFDWPIVACGILLVQVLSVVTAWYLFSRLLSARWVRVPLLAVFAWSPLTLVTSLWWSASMGLWPGVLAAVVAVLWLVRDLDQVGHRWVNLSMCLLAVLFGLAWHERAILIAPLLFGVAVCMSSAPGIRRVRDTLVRGWPLWASLLVLCGGYLVMHTWLTTVGEQKATAGDYAGILWNALARNALPGVVSGPWQAQIQGGAVEPAAWVTVTSCLLVVGMLVALIRYGGSDAVWAMLMLATNLTIAMGMLLLGRAGFGQVIGLDPRYTSDVVAVTTIFLALACRRPVRPGLRRSRRLPSSWVSLSATALYAGGAAFGTAALVPQFQNHDDRTYVSNLRTDFAKDPTQIIVDELVPATILLPLLGEESLSSEVFAPLPENPVYDEPAGRLSRVASNGHLRPVTLESPAAMRPGTGQCGYPVERRPVRIPLENPVTGTFGGPIVTRVGYFSDHEADVRVRTTGFDQEFRAKRGPNLVWLVIPSSSGQVDAYSFQVVSPDGGTVCVANLFAGGLAR